MFGSVWPLWAFPSYICLVWVEQPTASRHTGLKKSNKTFKDVRKCVCRQFKSLKCKKTSILIRELSWCSDEFQNWTVVGPCWMFRRSRVELLCDVEMFVISRLTWKRKKQKIMSDCEQSEGQNVVRWSSCRSPANTTERQTRCMFSVLSTVETVE